MHVQYNSVYWLKKRVILISLLIEPPSPVHQDGEATPLLHNSRNRDNVAAPLSPNCNSSNMKAVKGECQIPSLSSSTATDSTARLILILAIDNDDGFNTIIIIMTINFIIVTCIRGTQPTPQLISHSYNGNIHLMIS